METKNTPNMEELDLDQLTNVSGGGVTIPLVDPKAVYCPYHCGWAGLSEEPRKDRAHCALRINLTYWIFFFIVFDHFE